MRTADRKHTLGGRLPPALEAAEFFHRLRGRAHQYRRGRAGFPRFAENIQLGLSLGVKVKHSGSVEASLKPILDRTATPLNSILLWQENRPQ